MYTYINNNMQVAKKIDRSVFCVCNLYMLNALVNYKYLLGNLAAILEKFRFFITYALVNQHVGSLYSQPSKNRILAVEKGAFLITKKTNLYVGVMPQSREVVVHVMRKNAARVRTMHRFLAGESGYFNTNYG